MPRSSSTQKPKAVPLLQLTLQDPQQLTCNKTSPPPDEQLDQQLVDDTIEFLKELDATDVAGAEAVTQILDVAQDVVDDDHEIQQYLDLQDVLQILGVDCVNATRFISRVRGTPATVLRGTIGLGNAVETIGNAPFGIIPWFSLCAVSARLLHQSLRAPC